MRRAVSFGDYLFPMTVPLRGVLLSTNFGNAVPRTSRLPGLDGGYDEYGDDPAAREIGNVRVRFALIAGSPAEMATKRDAVMAMVGYGVTALTIETSAGGERWTWAKVNNISMPTEHDSLSDQMVNVTVDFQAALPGWFSTSDDSPQVEACSGTATTFPIANGGNAMTLPVITVDPGVGGLASGVTIQRIVSAQVVDEIDFDAALIGSDLLVIDCKALSVRKNGADAYGSVFSADHPAWMRLQPGANEIKVILGGGESADVTFEWDDAWY